MPISQVCTDKDKKLTLILEMYNWSSNHPTSMILYFIEILLNYLQLYYYHLQVIQQLFGLKHTKQQFCPKHGQNLTCNFRQQQVELQISQQGGSRLFRNISKPFTTLLKTPQANSKVNQVKHHKEDISIQIRTNSVIPLHKLITGDLDHQKR